MPQSHSRVLIHLVFSTKNRERILAPAIQQELHAYMTATLNNIDCACLQAGGVEDHVHLLFGLSRTSSVAEVVETIKVSSSKWIKSKGPEFRDFHWQSGYGAFSVGPSDAEAVIAYIQSQAARHRKTSFQDEYRELLERCRLKYDERYVWD